MAEETIKRLTLGDPRTPGEKVAALIARAASPDKDQNRKWDDSPTQMAINRRKTEQRIADEKARR